MDTVLLIQDEAALQALPWAQRLAARAGQRLVLLVFTPDPIQETEAIEAPEDSDSELVQSAFRLHQAPDAPDGPVLDCRGPNGRRAVLNTLLDLEVGQLVLHQALPSASMVGFGLVHQVARAAPYDVLLLDCGGLEGPPRRVLFAQAGGGGVHGLRFAARDFCAPDLPLVVMPDPKAGKSSARNLRRVREELAHGCDAVIQETDTPETLEAGLHAAASPYDLVMADADEPRHLAQLLAILRKLRAEKPELGFSIAISRSANAAGPGMLERALERYHAHVPRLGRAERRSLAETLDRGGRLSADFVIMLMLSAVIAALGLIQNSAAVVIGGMLVAPLMTPMLAMGLSLVQGNAHMFRKAFEAMGLGVLGALLASMAMGLLSPWDDLSAEVVARGGPNVFDLGVALFSGIAAAFALARPGLAGTLVGVAVAVALVPPIAATGIALVKAEFAVAFGAAMLFLTNWLAIVLGASLVFRLFGLDVSLGGSRAPAWVRMTFAGFAIALVPTILLLFHNLGLQMHDGVHRPYARPLPSDMREAIVQRVDRETGVRIVTMSQSDIEHGFGKEVVLAVTGTVSPTLESDLLAILGAREVVISGPDGDRRVLTPGVRVQLLRAVE